MQGYLEQPICTPSQIHHIFDWDMGGEAMEIKELRKDRDGEGRGVPWNASNEGGG